MNDEATRPVVLRLTVEFLARVPVGWDGAKVSEVYKDGRWCFSPGNIEQLLSSDGRGWNDCMCGDGQIEMVREATDTDLAYGEGRRP